MIKKLFFLLGGFLLCSSAQASMTVSVESLTLNNMAIQNLSCQISSGGMAELLRIAGALSKLKEKLDVCASELAGFKTSWTFAGGKVKAAKVYDEKTLKNNSCIEKALIGKEFADSGSCEALIFLGKEAASLQ